MTQGDFATLQLVSPPAAAERLDQQNISVHTVEADLYLVELGGQLDVLSRNDIVVTGVAGETATIFAKAAT